jgi:hypothetical protein
MANVCIGDGLTTDSQGRLTLNTQAWPFPVSVFGPFAQPLGFSGGLVFAPPRQIVQQDLYSGDDFPALNYDSPDNTDPDGFSRTFFFQLHNVDPGRRMHGIALIEIDVRFLLQPGAEVSVHAVGGNEAHRFRNDGASTRALHFEFTRNLTVSIPPGGDQTLTWDVSTALLQGVANVTGIFQTFRVMAVSSQPV